MFSNQTCEDPDVWASDRVPALFLQDNIWGIPHHLYSGFSNPDGSLPSLDLVETMCPDGIEEKLGLALLAAVNAVFEGERLAHQAWAGQPGHEAWEGAARILGSRVGEAWEVDSRMSAPPGGEAIRNRAEEEGLLREVPPPLVGVWVQVAQKEAIRIWCHRCCALAAQPAAKEDFE